MPATCIYHFYGEHQQEAGIPGQELSRYISDISDLNEYQIT